MYNFAKKIWKHSRLRFYILNAVWNYKFWLFAKAYYKTINYNVEEGEFDMNYDFKIKKEKKNVNKQRFVGYFFDNNIYLDNPGLKIEDRETWEVWKRKGLVK